MDPRRHAQYISRWEMLRTEQAGYRARWMELSRAFLPHTGQFNPMARNDGRRRMEEIYDSTGTRSLRTLAAGLMAGMTSPARPWFRLTTSDPDLDESHAVKTWLANLQRRMLMYFTVNNSYRILHTTYEELGLYGTASCVIAKDPKDVWWGYPQTAGQYAIATNHRGEVVTLYRMFEMSVAELVGEFGLANVGVSSENFFKNGQLDIGVIVVHVIEPRADREHGKRDNLNMPWKSVYFELNDRTRGVLRESGFRRFPAVCPRWAVAGGDIYGHGPGHEALGDVRSLQHLHKRKSQVYDYQTMPPIEAPASLAGNGVDLMPGGVNFHDGGGSGQGIRSLWDVRLDMSGLLHDIADTRERVRSAFHADLFLMLANSDRRNMTATEVAQRYEEKLLMLGPVLERLHNELLSPMVDLAFDAMVESGLMESPPLELQGKELSVEFVSMLAQAQRSVATNGIDRFVANLGALAQIKPEVLDKLNADQWVDAYSDMLGIDPDLIVPGEQVAIIRQQRAEQQAAMLAQQQAAVEAQTAKDLGSVKTDQQNLATDVIGMVGGQ